LDELGRTRLAAKLNVPSLIEFVRQDGQSRRICILCKDVFSENGDNWSHALWDCEQTEQLRMEAGLTRIRELESTVRRNEVTFRAQCVFEGTNISVDLFLADVLRHVRRERKANGGS
jgi:hypothetical protein